MTFEEILRKEGFQVVKTQPNNATVINNFYMSTPAIDSSEFLKVAKLNGIKTIFHYDLMDIYKAGVGMVDRETYFFPMQGMIVMTIVENE